MTTAMTTKTNKTPRKNSTKSTTTTQSFDVSNSSSSAYKDDNRMLILSFAEIFSTLEFNAEFDVETFECLQELT